MMIVLGLDISTTNVGFSVIEAVVQDDTGECHHVKHSDSQRHRLIKTNVISIHALQGLYGKSRYTRDKLIGELSGIKIDMIAIEEPLMSFRRSGSSASVLALLNRFNGMVSFIARDSLNAPVVFVNSSVARKCVGIKLDRSFDTKEQILAWAKIHPLMKDYPWPTKIMKAGKRKGETVNVVSCYDIADAFVTAMWACKTYQDLNNVNFDTTIC